MSKAAVAAVAAGATEGREQWIDGPAAETWVDGPAPPVKAFVRDWVEKHSAPEEDEEIEEETAVVEPVVESRPSERTLAWVKALTTVEQPSPDPEDRPPAYDICMQQQPESIYELQMDETLETISGDKSYRNTFTSDDGEDFLAAHCEDDVDQSDGIAVDGESDGDNDDDGESDEHEEEEKIIMRPTCLRRPDGSSNPNLCGVTLVEEVSILKRGVSINDSDSGNDFGVVAAGTAVAAVKCGQPEVVSSSGYESMIRGSGDTASCSSGSSAASSSSDNGKGVGKIEPLLIQEYSMDDVERMGRRRREEEMRATCKRRHKVQELLLRQERLKKDLAHAKRLLMVCPSSWSFDLHVAEQMEQDNPHYLEALDKETHILEKRVEAAKSRIMLVTCFDSFNV